MAFCAAAEMSPVLLGIRQGATPDAARKLRLEATKDLAKTARKSLLVEPAIALAIELAQRLDQTTPLLRSYPIDNVGVHMRDGLPVDGKDLANEEASLWRSAGLLSVEGGVAMRIEDPDAAAVEVQLIEDDESGGRVNRIQIGIAIVVASLLVAAATPRSAGMATPELFDSGVPRGSSEILAGYYTDAAKRIKQVVENPSGRTAGSKEFKRARAATLIDQVDQVLGQLGHATSGWIGKNVPAAAVAGRKLANKQAVEAGVRPKGQAAIEGSFHLIDHRAVQVLAIDAFRDLNKAAQGRARRGGDQQDPRRRSDRGEARRDDQEAPRRAEAGARRDREGDQQERRR
jgi:hypothetical protein